MALPQEETGGWRLMVATYLKEGVIEVADELM